MREANVLNSELSLNSIDEKNIVSLIDTVKRGIKYGVFMSVAKKIPFTMAEWCNFLHISERTMQRYKKEKKTFDSIYSEKILEIALLYKTGVQVFGNNDNFKTWLESKNLTLGGLNPKSLLDNTFGISLVKDELNRIEHGILA